jgi:hypothetical protein
MSIGGFSYVAVSVLSPSKPSILQDKTQWDHLEILRPDMSFLGKVPSQETLIPDLL